GLLAQVVNVLVHCFLSFLNDFLDPRRVDSAVLDQALKGELGDFAPNAVEPSDNDNTGRVIDDDVDAGRLLESADIATLAADDPALHVIIGNIHGAHGDFGSVCRGAALNSGCQNVPCLRLAQFSHLDFIPQDATAHFAAELVLDAAQQHVA